MNNLGIARVLAEIGDLLEIKNENPFKIRAYRNAAETILHLGSQVADMTAAERLAIPGVGKDLAGKLAELAETGTIPYHQDLLAEFPPTILDLLHLQGVGPKTFSRRVSVEPQYGHRCALLCSCTSDGAPADRGVGGAKPEARSFSRPSRVIRSVDHESSITTRISGSAPSARMRSAIASRITSNAGQPRNVGVKSTRT